MIGDRLQEALDSPSLERSDTAQEGLQVAGAELYLEEEGDLDTQRHMQVHIDT